MDIKSDISWLRVHERLIICAMVLIVVMLLGNRWLDSSATKAEANAAVAAQLASEAKLSAQQAAQQSAQMESQYQAMVDVLTKQNAALAQAITQRDSVLGQQQANIKTASLSDVAKKWQAQVGPGISMGQGGITADDTASRETVNRLLELLVVKADLDDEKQTVSNTQAELGKANDVISADKVSISALNAQIVADDKKCKADIAKVTADGRKSKRNWAIFGAIAGFVGRQLIHSYVGI